MFYFPPSLFSQLIGARFQHSMSSDESNSVWQSSANARVLGSGKNRAWSVEHGVRSHLIARAMSTVEYRGYGARGQSTQHRTGVRLMLTKRGDRADASGAAASPAVFILGGGSPRMFCYRRTQIQRCSHRREGGHDYFLRSPTPPGARRALRGPPGRLSRGQDRSCRLPMLSFGVELNDRAGA